MKSYFLEELPDETAARAALSELLPYWINPWLLGSKDEAVAYLNANQDAECGVMVQADISGRHDNEDGQVLTVLRQLQERVGDILRDDDDSEL